MWQISIQTFYIFNPLFILFQYQPIPLHPLIFFYSCPSSLTESVSLFFHFIGGNRVNIVLNEQQFPKVFVFGRDAIRRTINLSSARYDKLYGANGGWTESVSAKIQEKKTWKLKQLQLGNNQRATLMKEIAHIRFSHLTKLELYGNEIESIEGVGRVSLPHLQNLFLNHNCITSISALRKVWWPSLEIFDISKNYFRECESFTECFWRQMRIVGMYHISEEVNTFAQICFPAKIEAPCLRGLVIQSQRFCFHRSIKSTLKKRWLSFSPR